MRQGSGPRQYRSVGEFTLASDWNRGPFGCTTFEFACGDQVKLSRRSVGSDQDLRNIADGDDVSAANKHPGEQWGSVRKALQLVRTRQFCDRACRQSEALLSYWKKNEGVLAGAERNHRGCAHADTACFAWVALVRAACTSLKSPADKNASAFTTGTTAS